MDPDDSSKLASQRAVKVEKLREILSGSFSNSISKLSGCSRTIPSGKDFHFYSNFEEVRVPVRKIVEGSEILMGSVGNIVEHLVGKRVVGEFGVDDVDEAYEWVVSVNDEVFENVDASLDEFKRVRKREEESGVRISGAKDDDGFHLVIGRKKKFGDEKPNVPNVANVGNVGSLDSPSCVKVVGKDGKVSGGKAKVPFHIHTIPRPQDEYKILVNNANQPFEHVWLEKSEDGSRLIHPLEKFSFMEFVDKPVANAEPVKPPAVESSPFKLVEQVKDLKELAAKLRAVDEFAVDLEHNAYRSFQGLTCLMQISTRTEDFIVDTLKLRIHIGPYLREVFKDPTKKKVMHGADRDIIWLQRDFGIYVCNMFDTGQASRVLKLERNSLEHLLQHFCGVTANKEYQNADWRLRPLTDVMLRYARDDTHYLLYIYDLMKLRLFSSPAESESSEEPIVEVYRRSYDICMQLYEKEILTESSYRHIYGLQDAGLNAQQLSVVASLCEWRDVVARAEDESTGFILPNKSLLEIAKQMPVTANNLRHVLKSKHPYIERNLGSVVTIIRHAIQNAAAFEDAAKQLKEEAEAKRNKLNANGTQASNPQEATSRSTSAAVTGGALCSSSHLGGNGNVVASIAQGDPLTSSEQAGETNTSVNMLRPVSGATVLVQKKPSRAFGALLGNPAAKRKFDPAKKAEEEIKVEQIKSSVNLPFYSFATRTEHIQPLAKEPADVQPIVNGAAKPPETPGHEHSVSMPSTSSNTEDIILLESNSDGEKAESSDGKAENSDSESADDQLEHREDIVPDFGTENDEDTPMTLSDLSTSFQKCFDSNSQKRKGKQIQKANDGESVLQLKPFDYEAARKNISFGGDLDDVHKGENVSRRKNSLEGNSRESEATGSPVVGRRRPDLPVISQQGRRRQAFPASGNRSATFR